MKSETWENRLQVIPYEGNEDYIFISYSHQDMDLVLPVLRHLQDNGVRFWYDEGIDPGSEWPEAIARHLNGCRACLAFMSPNSLGSPNCRREVNFALSKNKEFLSVILNPVEMSLGMEMQIASYQSIVKYRYQSDEQFLEKLMSVELITSCQDGHSSENKMDGAAGAAAPRAVPSFTAPAAAPKAPGKRGLPKKALMIGGGVAALLLVLILALPGKSSDSDVPGIPTEQEEDTSSEQPAVSRTDSVLMRDSLFDENVSYEEFCEQEHSVFGSGYFRNQISAITFLDTLEEAPNNAWDVSEAGDGSIMAWAEPNGSLFDLYIGAEGGIIAPADCTYLFAGYEAIESINFNGVFDTANVENMAYMFYMCGNLKELDISQLNTAEVTDMHAMFTRCGNLKELDVSVFDTAKVTDMYAMFSMCGNLKELDVSELNTANATDMGYMFEGCSSLEALDVSSFDTANVTYMDGMFFKCSGLKQLDVSELNTANVTDMSYMFEGCSSLKVLDVSGFDTANVTDMTDMFQDCSSLEVLDVSGFNTARVTSMWAMFNGCGNVKVLDVSRFDTANVTNMSVMFQNCSSLEVLDVSRFNTSNVTTMEAMFYNCSSLKELDVIHFDTAKVTNMRVLFYNCSNLTRLTLDFNTANVTDMSYMFAQCGKLTDLFATDVWDPSNAKREGMFDGTPLA